MLYCKKGIFTFSLTTWSAKLPYTEQSNDYMAPIMEGNLKKYHVFVFSGGIEQCRCEGKRNAFLLCSICALSFYSHLLKKISFKTVILICDTRDIQLDSKIMVVAKGNPNHSLKTIRNV